MAYTVASPYIIYVPSPVPMPAAPAGSSADPLIGYEFYPDYWVSM